MSCVAKVALYISTEILTGATVFQVLLSGPYQAFTVALGLLGGLLLVEMIALLLGASIMSDGVPDIAEGFDGTFDLPAGAEPDLAALVAASDAMQSDVPAMGESDGGGVLALLGLGRVPFAIWLAALLTGFGVSGIAVQSVATSVWETPLPPAIAAVPAGAIGIAFARGFGRVLSRLLPSVETTATSAQFMGGLRGVVSQGTARLGIPAEVRLRDRHGNTHHIRCEPFRAEDTVGEGTEVLLVRQRTSNGWSLKIVPLSF
jgi:hypothetical protein